MNPFLRVGEAFLGSEESSAAVETMHSNVHESYPLFQQTVQVHLQVFEQPCINKYVRILIIRNTPFMQLSQLTIITKPQFVAGSDIIIHYG